MALKQNMNNQISLFELLHDETRTVYCKECGKGFGKLAHFTILGIKICNRCCELKPTIKDGHGFAFHNCGNYCHIKEEANNGPRKKN